MGKETHAPLRSSTLTHDLDVMAVAMHGALADVDAELRERYPKIFALTDILLSDPERRGTRFRTHSDVDALQRYEMRECAWCGDDFVAEKRHSAMSCSSACGALYSQWKKRREHVA